MTDTEQQQKVADEVKQVGDDHLQVAQAAKIMADVDAKKASVEAFNRAMQIETTYMSPNTWTQIRTMAKVFHEGKALPSCIQNEAQLVMVMQAGFEMGMKPVECLKSLYIVKGTINVYGPAVMRRLREHGWLITYKEDSDKSCTATISRGDETYTETLTFAEAEKSGYTKDGQGALKIGWKEGVNRKMKLRYGVLSIIIKSYVPEVLGSAVDIAEVAEDQQDYGNQVSEKQTAGTPVTVRLVAMDDDAEQATHKTLAEKIADSKKEKDIPEPKGDGITSSI